MVLYCTPLASSQKIGPSDDVFVHKLPFPPIAKKLLKRLVIPHIRGQQVMRIENTLIFEKKHFKLLQLYGFKTLILL